MEPLPHPGVVVGAAPVLRALADRIGLVAVIDQVVAWDPERCRLSPGERILALVLNLLTGRPPLYQVTDAFRLTDVPLLLGPGVAAEDLTDDAWGRALDKLAAAGPALDQAGAIVSRLGETRGGNPRVQEETRRALAVMLASHVPGQKIPWSSLEPALRHRDLSISRTAEILDLAGLLEFITPDPQAWLTARLAELDAGATETPAAAARQGKYC